MLTGGRALKVWSAGCSFGAEPYTLAMILADLAPSVRHSLTATDIDQKILQKAQRGIFTEADVKNVPPAAKARYLKPRGADYEVAPSIRDRIAFRRHNLLADRFEADHDLIVCRNVVIYFTEQAKDELFRRFAAALRPGGVLFVGGTERVFNAREIGLESKIPFFYERVR
jgi:chemotaxis protein methyltransferase CheR